MGIARFKCLTIAAALLAVTGAWAQFDPARVHTEPPPVHARFAAPAVQFHTPAFDPWQIDFTSHAQMMARLQALAGSPSVHLETVGESGQGRLVHLARRQAPGHASHQA